jgi:hypothetical protein
MKMFVGRIVTVPDGVGRSDNLLHFFTEYSTYTI